MISVVIAVVASGIFALGTTYGSMVIVTNRRERTTRPHVVAARRSLLRTIWSRTDADYRFACRRANGDELRIVAHPVSVTADAMVEIRITRHSGAGYGKLPDVQFYRIYRWDLRVAKALRLGGARNTHQYGYAEAAELREIEQLIHIKHSLAQSPR